MISEIAVSVAADLLSGSAMEAIKSLVASTQGRQSISSNASLPPLPELKQIRAWFIAELRVAEGDEFETDGVKAYLLSPEIITAIEHIFAFELAGQTDIYSQVLQEEVLTGLSHYGVTNPALTKELFSAIRNVVGLAIEGSYGERSDRNEAKFARGTVRPLTDQAHSLIQAMTTNVLLQAMHAQLSSLTNVGSTVSHAQVSVFLRSYRAAALPTYAKIQPPSLEGAEPVDIEKIYVAPTLSFEDRELSIEQLIRLSRAVVLGDPGGGKTSLTTKIAHELLQADTAKLSRGDCPVTPFVIVLREFAAEWKVKPQSVVEFLVNVLKSKFQVQVQQNLIEWLLLSGQAFIVFDGLDELLDTRLRSQVRDIIQSFEARYTNTHILVTSRLVGYDMAPLPIESFPKILLGPFTVENVGIYVRKWFELSARLRSDALEGITAKFLAESEVAADIRTNPLMLGLMCTIYRSEGYIPRNRPVLYEKCSRLLFDTWDRRRDLLQRVEYEAHIEPALMYLANWIFEDEARRTGVSEQALIRKAADYLETKQYGQREPAEYAARNFITFCRGRGWVFTDVGLDEHDERLYRFTHQTFLEYFTAAHLARVNDVDSLVGLIIERAARAEWDIVAQLSLQIKTRAIDRGPDLAVTKILSEINSRETSEARELAGFLCRCLAFLPLEPLTVDSLADTLWELFIEWALVESGSPSNPVTNSWSSLMSPLMTSAPEIKGRIASRLALCMSQELSNATDLRLEIVTSVASHLAGLNGRDGIDSRWYEAYEELSPQLCDLLSRHQAEWRWALPCLFYDYPLLADFNAVTLQSIYSEAALPGTPFRYFAPGYALCRILILRTCDSATPSPSDMQLLIPKLASALTQVDVDEPVAESMIGLSYLFKDDFAKPRECQHAKYSDNFLTGAAYLMAGLIEVISAGRRTNELKRVARNALSEAGGMGHLEFMKPAIARRLKMVELITSSVPAAPKDCQRWLGKWGNGETSILPDHVLVNVDPDRFDLDFDDPEDNDFQDGDDANGV